MGGEHFEKEGILAVNFKLKRGRFRYRSTWENIGHMAPPDLRAADSMTRAREKNGEYLGCPDFFQERSILLRWPNHELSFLTWPKQHLDSPGLGPKRNLLTFKFYSHFN